MCGEKRPPRALPPLPPPPPAPPTRALPAATRRRRHHRPRRSAPDFAPGAKLGGRRRGQVVLNGCATAQPRHPGPLQDPGPGREARPVTESGRAALPAPAVPGARAARATKVRPRGGGKEGYLDGRREGGRAGRRESVRETKRAKEEVGVRYRWMDRLVKIARALLKSRGQGELALVNSNARVKSIFQACAVRSSVKAKSTRREPDSDGAS